MLVCHPESVRTPDFADFPRPEALPSSRITRQRSLPTWNRSRIDSTPGRNGRSPRPRSSRGRSSASDVAVEGSPAPPGSNRPLSADDKDFMRGSCPGHEPPVSRGHEEPPATSRSDRPLHPRTRLLSDADRGGGTRTVPRAGCAWSWTSAFACHFGYTVDLLGVRSVRGSHANTRDTTRSLLA
jgi:hypothetical protein